MTECLQTTERLLRESVVRGHLTAPHTTAAEKHGDRTGAAAAAGASASASIVGCVRHTRAPAFCIRLVIMTSTGLQGLEEIPRPVLHNRPRSSFFIFFFFFFVRSS
jgi:hypothetical protein